MSESLQGKHILLGVSGSIAAYKAAVLVRLLVKAGATVRVIMTPDATHFVTPLTFSTLSKQPVFASVATDSGWNNHVELGLWADALVIAPATANTLAKLAVGICDNMLTACYLSARCPVFFAPAMDVDMWHHPATQGNVSTLRQRGNHLIPVGKGELASGLNGEGRMAEPEEIIHHLAASLTPLASLAGKSILITAGPTYEPIDPVRFIGNRSSGKMGVALAHAAAARGAQVTLILGPSTQTVQANIHLVRVETASEMYEAALAHWPTHEAAILSAAVSDYRPPNPQQEKIKKKGGESMHIELVQNPDIAASLGQRKAPNQILIGFALETTDAEANALQKLHRKNFDCIVLNSMSDPGAGFNTDTNKVTLFFGNNKRADFKLKSKKEVADDILDALQHLFNQPRLAP